MTFEEITSIFDIFLGAGGIAAALFFLFLYRLVRSRDAKFSDALTCPGVIIDVDRVGRGYYYPVIEYSRDGKTIQFRSDLSVAGAAVGEVIELELSADGVARVKSKGHPVIRVGLGLMAACFFIIGVVFLARVVAA